MIEHLHPAGLFDGRRLGFSQVVTATPGTMVWIAGQTATAPSGHPLGGDHAEQARAALANLGLALVAAGATPAHVTMFRAYIVGFTRDVARAVAAPVSEFFEGGDPPASTWVGVEALMHPDFLVELEAVAVVPDQR